MRYNLILGVFWLLVGVGLIVAYLTGYELLGLERHPIIGMFAILLAAWNFARLSFSGWMSARRSPPPEPPKRRPVEPAEYNPSFDFTRDEPK
ncbi:MAG: hypothetical protein ACJ8F7_11735 [Gemmataceae bacterium]